VSGSLALTTLGAELTRAQFDRIRELMYAVSGVHLRPGKEALVRSRLVRRLQAVSVTTFGEYLGLVEGEASRLELRRMVEALTTNKTSFFRESDHFHVLREHVRGVVNGGGRRIRLWSAGCSSGEEPYTMAMVLEETVRPVPGADLRILATDISSRALRRARAACYTARALADVPLPYRGTAFERYAASPRHGWRVRRELRAMVRVAQLNLAGAWPMRGPFDAIMCRNVMIYFDEPMRRQMIDRCWDLLAPGGLLFVGHSESLGAIEHRFTYRRPAVYAK
jgi:chemotaxis protein methyltransferase CheR